jgi:hypothetical protein
LERTRSGLFVSRRRFVATAGAALFLSGCRLVNRIESSQTGAPASAAPAAPTPAVQSPLAAELEQKYDIRLITKAMNDERHLVSSEVNGVDVLLEWDEERIKIIGEALAVLPDVFYRGKTDRRSGDFRRVHMALLKQVDTPGHTFAIAAETRPYFNTDPVVIFIANAFPTSARGRAYSRSVVIHELAHKVSTIEHTDSYEVFFKPTGMKTPEDLRNTYASIASHDASGRQTFTSASNYGASNMEEHGAIAAEHYAMGKEIFYKGLAPGGSPELGILDSMGYLGYQRFLGKDNTDNFYQALKKNMFEGREYDAQKVL